MPSTLAELKLEIQKQSAQLAALQKRADEIRNEEREGILDGIRAQIAEYDITPAELGLETARAAGRGRAPGAPGKRGGAKYVGPQGQLWSGRGRRPHWFGEALAAGKTPADLELKPR